MNGEHDEQNDAVEDAAAAKELAALGILKGAAKDDHEQVARAVWPALMGSTSKLAGFTVERPCLQTLIIFHRLNLELTAGVPASECSEAVQDAIKVITVLRLPVREATVLVEHDYEKFEQLCVETACELPPTEPAALVVEVINFLNEAAKGQVKAELPDDLKSKDTPKKKAQRRRGL